MDGRSSEKESFRIGGAPGRSLRARLRRRTYGLPGRSQRATGRSLRARLRSCGLSGRSLGARLRSNPLGQAAAAPGAGPDKGTAPALRPSDPLGQAAGRPTRWVRPQPAGHRYGGGVPMAAAYLWPPPAARRPPPAARRRPTGRGTASSSERRSARRSGRENHFNIFPCFARGHDPKKYPNLL